MNNISEFNAAKSELIPILNSADTTDLDQFRQNLLKWLDKFRIYGLHVIWEYKYNKEKSPSLLSEILEVVGIADLEELDSVRIDLFKSFFKSENLEIRHGVVEGVANLDSRIAIPILEEFLNLENSKVLKQKIISYIEQLKELRKY